MSAAALLVVAAGGAFADGASDAKERVGKLAEAKSSEFWALVSEIEQIGPEAAPALQEGLKAPEPKVRLGCAKAMYRIGEKKEGAAALVQLVREKDKDVRRHAADLIADLTRDDANFGSRKDMQKALLEALDGADDQKFQIALSRALYSVANDLGAIDTLKKLLTAKDTEVRKDAALALAELNDFEVAMPVLKRIAAEPGDKGAMARLYLKHKELQDALLRRVADKPSAKYALLDEMIELVKARYVDQARTDEAALLEGAARGIAETLDPFSAYLNEKDLRELQEGMNKVYGGIGAHVSTRDDWLTIERPVYSGPAYRGGLRALDRITEIAGWSTYKRPIEDCVTRLKGEPGTKVTFKVARRGWSEPREFSMDRERITIKTATCEMLPGKVGLIQINSFGGDTNEDMRACIDRMMKEGAVALVLDLRNNPGGLLNEVVAMLDRFVPAGQVLCTTKDRHGKEIERLESKDDDKLSLPVSVLVNEGSASASEIMSGAMQDLKLATVIGERSYGKGSVQRIEPMKATRGKTAFKMTFAKYYLPSGRSIHIDRDRYGRVPDGATGGVVPDIEVKMPERDLWKEYEFAKILDSGALDKYVEAHWEKDREALTKVAESIHPDAKNIPGFDGFVADLKSKAEPAELAQLLRTHIRRKVADERSREFLVDLHMDVQAQRAVVEALKLANVDPKSVEEYKDFAMAPDPK
jgi:carboxyl-terminal processing protease